MSKYRKLTLVGCAAVLALGLAACGSSSDDDDDQTMMECPAGQIGTYPDCSDPLTPYQTASAKIEAATTAEAAQAAYDEVKGDVTAAQGEMLQEAVDRRIGMIEKADRATDQKMDLAVAAGMIDTSDLSTQEAVDAARTAIAGLREALDDAVDVSDADKAMYQDDLGDAVDAVDMAQGGIDTDTRRTNQMTALSDASGVLQTALAALSGATPTQAQLNAANDALTDLNDAITSGADLTETEKAPYQREADNSAAPIRTAQTAFEKDEDDAQKVADDAMTVTAAKLHAGINAPEGTDGTGNDDYFARYDTAETGIEVFIGTGTAPGTAIPLSLDKDTTVADNHGWAGKRYADPAGGDLVEAVVYSNIEDPKEGKKFGSDAAVPNDNFQYQLSTDAATRGELTTIVAANVASPSFDHSAGTKEFDLQANTVRVPIAGTYHGVSGTYYCTPTGGGTDCSAAVATDGFTLAGGTWTFKPADANARVMESADTAYASYGWWLRKAANNGAFAASAFVDFKGDPADVDIANLVAGTARYVGGAAGKYALSSSTGGTNDAGHFTAMATLDAEFGDATAGNTITGTIGGFMGADGMTRDWSVKLNKTAVTDGGVITALTTTAAAAATVWTIGENPAAGSGQWSGNLREEGDDGVPQVATGTFYTEYGTAGKMVGAFGANKTE